MFKEYIGVLTQAKEMVKNAGFGNGMTEKQMNLFTAFMGVLLFIPYTVWCAVYDIKNFINRF